MACYLHIGLDHLAYNTYLGSSLRTTIIKSILSRCRPGSRNMDTAYERQTEPRLPRWYRHVVRDPGYPTVAGGGGHFVHVYEYTDVIERASYESHHVPYVDLDSGAM